MRQLFEDKKLYLEPDLTLADVAQAMALSANKVSQLFNEQGGQSFYEIVNDYRIRHAISLLSERRDDKFKIIEIYTDAGFSTESTFYKYFKKTTGKTPRQYLKE